MTNNDGPDTKATDTTDVRHLRGTDVIASREAREPQDQAELDLEGTDEEVEGESKSDRFKRMMNGRYTKAVERVRLMKNLSARGNYDYTDDDVTKVFTALRAEIDEVEAAFRSKDRHTPIERLF